MPTALASDGTELHWEERSSGQNVLFVPYWSYHPSVWRELDAELKPDHRLLRYDDRGTGQSAPADGLDVETGADDMESVLEATGGGPAIAVCMVDGANRAVRVAARRPDLISHVVSVGGAPFARSALADEDSLISSDTVVGAFLQQLETDYRGAVRGIVEAANTQMTDEELRERVRLQIEHVPHNVAAARVNAWSSDEGAVEPARTLGDRLLILLSDNMAGGWFPSMDGMKRAVVANFPDARVVEVDDGILSRPDQTAAVVRRLHGGVEAGGRDVESPA